MGERVKSVRSAVDLFFKKNPEIRTVGIFCWEDPWGWAYLKIWREVAVANNVTISGEVCSVDFASDFRSDVAKIAAEKVDAVIIASYSDVILKRMKEQKFSAKVLGSGDIVEDIKGKNVPAELFEGVYLTDWRPSEEFISKFQNKFSREPIVEAHNSYEALHSLAKALTLGESNVMSALRKVKYQGVAGPIDFTQSNYGNDSIAKLFRVERGEIREAR